MARPAIHHVRIFPGFFNTQIYLYIFFLKNNFIYKELFLRGKGAGHFSLETVTLKTIAIGTTKRRYKVGVFGKSQEEEFKINMTMIHCRKLNYT